MLEHLLRFSWFGTPSVVSYVLLHHDILFACYNIVDDDDEDDEEKKEKDEDENENEDEDEDEDKDVDEDEAKTVARLVDLDDENCLRPSFCTNRTSNALKGARPGSPDFSL